MLVAIALLPASLSIAQADQYDDTGFYVGGSYGLVRVDDSDFDDDNDFPQLFAGYQLFPFLGIEAAYMDFGRYGSSFANAETEGWNLALTGRLPITQNVALFAKAGPFWSDTTVKVAGIRRSYDSEDFLFGAGLSFQVAENWDLRLAYDWLDTDYDASDIGNFDPDDFNSDFQMVTVGLKYEF